MDQPSTARSFTILLKVANIVNEIFRILLIVFGVMVIILPTVYLFGSDKIYEPSKHPIYDVFYTQPYEKLTKTLDKHKNVLLYGDAEGGIVDYLKYYANSKVQQGFEVVLKNLTEEDDGSLDETLNRYRQYFYEDLIDVIQEPPTIWILLTINDKIPKNQLNHLERRHPKDKIIIMTHKKIKYTYYKTIEFDPIEIEQFQSQLMHSLDIEAKQAQILINFYKTIPNITLHTNYEQFSFEALLKENYRDLKSLNSSEKAILKELCFKGKNTNAVYSQNIEDKGTKFFNGSYFWNSHETRLNYQLQSGFQCKATLMSAQTKVKMLKFEQETRIAAEKAQLQEIQAERKRRQEVKMKASKRSPINL